MNSTHRFMIVADAHKVTAKTLATQIANTAEPGSADGMWTTGLNASGIGVPTHWISSGLIDAQFAALLGNAPATLDAFTQAGGTGITLAQVQALYAAATIRSDAQGQELACLAALGLKLIQEAV